MQEIIDQILEGNFDYENGSLDFSCAKLEITLSPGEIYEGTFRIFAAPGHFTRGCITTSDSRMECLNPVFTGTDEEIGFCFHGEYMEEGEVVKGEFYVISNQGEYYLPFVVSVEHMVLDSSIGSIKNLFHFANLAKSNWQEAVNLFYSPEFVRVFNGSDRQYYEVYRGLSAYAGNEQNVEEFLMEINKKQKLEFVTEEAALQLDNPYAVAEAQLTIVKNGWGYVHLNIETEGSFVFTEKETLTEDDFLGNYCRLPVYIDSSMCRRGKNFGMIHIYNPYVALDIPVTVRVGEGRGAAGNARLEKKRLLVQLMEFYQAFRLKKISTATWLKETGKLVEYMVALDEKDVAARLFQAQLLITEERFNEAGWLLEHAVRLLQQRQDGRNVAGRGSLPEETSVLWAYYFYLTTLLRREEHYINEAAEDVKQIYHQNRNSWRVAWLLLYLSEEYNRSAAGKWQFLERQFYRGCSSPVLYIEALLLVLGNPTLLRKLGEFEQQVLLYGAKQEMLGGEIMEQFLYLVGKGKDYSHTLFLILERCYRRNQDVRVLQEICTLLIKGGRTGQKYFEWYSKGVEKELRITKLYEYFMISIDRNQIQTLPKMVLMYFSYQNNLDYEQSAFLYSYILKHKEEYEELYAGYHGRIERFVLEQIQKEHINRHLAYLYQEFLTPGMIGEQTAPALAKLLFAHMIRVETPFIQKVIVCQPGNLMEQEYALQNGSAWVPLYGNEYTLLFEDGEGNRYTKNVVFITERLLRPGKLLSYVTPFVEDSLELDIYLCDSRRAEMQVTEESVKRNLRVAESSYAEPSMKHGICLKILKYFYDADDMRSLDSYLERISPMDLTSGEKKQVLYYMVIRGKNHIAYEWIRQFGPYFAEPKVLVRLLSEVMQQNDFLEDTVLSSAAEYVFRRGKYDGNVLRYLAGHFQGMTKEMRDIWKAAQAFEVDCYALGERMILQMLATGSFVGEKTEIFRQYVAQGGKPEVEEAYLSQCAYDFFVKERLTEEYVFEEICRMYQRGEGMQRICKLAFLKYYAENRNAVTTQIRAALKDFLGQVMTEGIHLNFMKELKEYPEMESLLRPLQDKTIIEYRAHPGAYVTMHYVVSHENGEAEEYLTEEMEPVFQGVCFKEFVLFFGEKLQYYIVEERDGEEQLTESAEIQNSDIRGENQGSRFELVNDIVISKTLEDYDTLDCLLEEYHHREFLNDRLFEIR